MQKEQKIAFFGTSEFSVKIADEMTKSGFKPSLVITVPDKPKGRKLLLTPPPLKIWAIENKIPILQPEKLNDSFFSELSKTDWDVFVVASYGKIISEKIINLPKFKTLNIHASLLPKYRGASPIETAILENDEDTGITIMLVDKEMDHGNIIASEKVGTPSWPPKTSELEKKMAEIGAKLLVKIMPEWIAGKIKAVPQNHGEATFTKKIKKEDGLIDLNGNPEKNFRKIQAFDVWPQTYFFVERRGKKIRVIVKDAELKDRQLIIKKVLPEGGKEISYEDFKRGF